MSKRESAMEASVLYRLKDEFNVYTRSFLTKNADADYPYQLKIDHTQRVCDNICRIGQTADLTDAELRMAEAVALFHDIGRFEQYRRFSTFNDKDSVNHAALGASILERQNFLTLLLPDQRERLLDAVRFHNVPALPVSRPPETLLFIRLIQDADKLDIWKIFADHCRQKTIPEAAVIQHLSTANTCSDAVLDSILSHKPGSFQDMRTFNDFKLVQLSWVFDLEFPCTRILAEQRGELRAIADSLPDTEKVRQAVGILLGQTV